MTDSESTPTSKTKILLVDDEINITKALRRLLMEVETYLHSHFTWAKLCHSRMTFPPRVSPRGFPRKEMSYNPLERHSLF